MRRSAVLLVLAFLAPLAPVFAGTVYVPLATQQAVGGVTYKTAVWVSNPSDVPRRFSIAFIASETNGTRAQAGGTATVQPKGSMLLTNVAPAGAHGMLQVQGAPQLVVRARLDAVSAAGRLLSSTPLPVIAADNVVPPRGTAHLQGLAAPAAGGVAGFALINLGAEPAQCTVQAFRPNGAPIGGVLTVTAPARGQRQLQAALAAQGVAALADARLEVSCGQAFYAYATQLAADGAQAVFVAPSGRLVDLELPRGPGDGETPEGPKPPVPPPPPPPTEPQPPAAPPGGPTAGTLISAPGVFLDVRDGDSYKAYELPLALDVRYRKVFVDFDLYFASWQGPWFHGITSLKRNDKTLYYGLMLKGEPTTKTIVDLGRDRQVKDQFPWRERTQYHVRMTYDITTKRVTAQVFQDGSVIETVSGKMTNSDLRAFGKYRVRVDFGLPGVAHSAYYPPYGSRYSNLTVRVER